MMDNKRAQINPHTYIATLIFVIGISVIIYILMLPPSDRADLLEQNRTVEGGVKNSIIVLMTKEPGTLSNIAETEITHDIPSFNLFSKTDSEVLISFDSIFLKKSLFEEQDRNLTFNVKDMLNTENYVLSFNAPRRSGILTILLNGKILSSEELLSQSPQPKRLPKDWLQKTSTLVFKISGPGVEFWKSNEYSLTDLKVTADVTDTSSQENKQSVLLTEQEKANLESFHLSFIADCKASEVSPMDIYLNKRLIYTSVPDCGDKVNVPIVDGSRLRQGENDLLFRTEKGSYLLYGIETKFKLKEPIYPTYYFSLSKEQYDKLKDDKADINVTLLFTNAEDMKKGTVFVNGVFFDINFNDMDFNKKVNNYIREGNNAIEIRPKSDKLDILELKVLMAE
jgi:hypothetical protein